MPAPSNANGASLGRPVIDLSLIQDPGARICFEKLLETLIGLGWPCGARSGDNVYQAVYAQSDGMGAHILYGGKPADPMNPDVLTVSASGSATVIWQDEGSTVVTVGTVSFEGAGVTVTDGGTKAIVTIPGGGGGGTVTEAFTTIDVDGQSSIVADSATDTLTVAAGTGIVITTNAGTDTITFAIDTASVTQNSFTTIAVSGQSSVVADSPTDTLTLVAGTNIVITTDAGSDTVTITSSDTTYTAGAGINLSGTKFVADPHTASHVGLVDPTTGDDSTADDAQIGILWHEIASYASAKNMLVGHAAGDTAKPVVEYKTVVDWLETIPDWDATKVQLLLNDGGNDGNEMRWLELKEVLKLLAGWDPADLQSIGHDAAGDPLWQDDDDTCP